MHLLYLYVKFYDTQGHPSPYRNFPFWSVNFSTDRYFTFIPETGELSEPESGRFIPKVPQGFWGNRIYNTTAFVSSNGGGKSTIMQYMILLLSDLEQNLPNPKRVTEDWVIVFGLDGDTIALQNKSVLVKDACPTIHASGEIICSCCGTQKEQMLLHIREQLLQTKLLYLSNVLSKADEVFQAEWLTNGADRAKRFLFDVSAYAIMHQAEQYRSKGENILQALFAQEQERMFHFLTSSERRSLLKKLRNLDYPVPVPQQLTVYINEEHFVNKRLLSNDIHPWERMAFPLSWKNVWTSQNDTLALRVERIIFSLCCGVAASCLKYFDRNYLPEDWFTMFKELTTVKRPTVYNGNENRVVCEEFLLLLDAVYALFQKKNFATERAGKIAQDEFRAKEKTLKLHINLWHSYIVFLCSEQSRSVLLQYLPPVDPLDRQLTLLGERARLKFIVPLDTVLREEDNGSQTAWFIDFYQQYSAACGDMPFLTLDWGLSSGEENLLKMFTNLQGVYSSVEQQKKIVCNAKSQINESVYECTTIWLFLDEADLTYHPEWQRQFMAILTAFLQEIYPPEICQEMQVFLSTHSPLMLGDFPNRCVTYLCCHRDGTKYVDDSGRVDTFGENLFTLLHSSFYLQKGEIGEIAKRKIQDVIDFLTETQEKLESRTLEDANQENLLKDLRKYQEETVSLLADGPIKTKLWLELNQLEDRLIRSGSSRESLIRALEAKLRYLKGEEEHI